MGAKKPRQGKNRNISNEVSEINVVSCTEKQNEKSGYRKPFRNRKCSRRN
jgi:hypothetical protein